MTQLFLSLVNLSIKASIIVLVIILIRLLFKRIPKKILCILWIIVGIRLVLPYTFESRFSLIPVIDTINVGAFNPINSNQYPTSVNHSLTSIPNTSLSTLSLYSICSIIWIIGIAIMLIYTVYSYYKIYKQVQISYQYKDHVYICDHIDTPFILGIFKPKIYIPSYLKEDRIEYVLKHEYTHIKRKDHYYKPIAYLLLTLYWFNPLLWISYILLSKDIEAACDEEVIKDMDNHSKKLYIETLLECSISNKVLSACPIAFSETDVKERTKNIVRYKKPGFIIMILSIVVCMIVGICYLSEPYSTMHIYDINDPSVHITILDNVEFIEFTYNTDSSHNTLYHETANVDDSMNLLEDIMISKKYNSMDRSEDRDHTYQIGLKYESGNITYINISEDCSLLWIDDGVKPSYSYKIKNREVIKELITILNSNS